MSGGCATEDDVIALLDGEVTENRAAALRAHLGRCSVCREKWASLERLQGLLRAPSPGVPLAGASERIVARIQSEPVARSSPSGPGRRRWVGAATAVAAAIAALALLAPRLDHWPTEHLAARGGRPGRSLRRDVGVTLVRAGARVTSLHQGDAVESDTTYAVAYRNLGPDGSAFLMVFAVDAAHAIHWIVPAYLDASVDPPSTPLGHADTDTLLPGAIVLEDLAAGPLRVVTLVSAEPQRVSAIEQLEPAALSLDRLRARFRTAEVSDLSLALRSLP
jgi:hypothetical protein